MPKITEKQISCILFVCMWDLYLPPSSLHCRSYDKDYKPLYQAGQGPVPCNGRKCPSPTRSTRTVRPGPVWCRSLGICWNNADRPGGKQPQCPQDWASSPSVQPPCSTALPQMHAPSSGCPSRPIAPTAKEPALALKRKANRRQAPIKQDRHKKSILHFQQLESFLFTWKINIQNVLLIHSDC